MPQIFFLKLTNRIIKPFRQNIIIIGIYCFYLITLPRIVSFLIPCLKKLPGQSFSYSQCHITLALDKFIYLALIGLGLTLFAQYFKQRHIFQTLFLSILLSLCAIASYYIYIPRIEKQITSAPIILEPL